MLLLLRQRSILQTRRSFFWGPLKSHTERRLVGYSIDQMYSLVSDVQHYKLFLPGCIESNIISVKNLSNGQREMKAELAVGVSSLLTERYTSIVHCSPPFRVQVCQNFVSLIR